MRITVLRKLLEEEQWASMTKNSTTMNKIPGRLLSQADQYKVSGQWNETIDYESQGIALTGRVEVREATYQTLKARADLVDQIHV